LEICRLLSEESDISTSIDSSCPSSTPTLTRCCQRHEDWATLAQHLADDFSDVTLNDIVRAVGAAHRAVLDVGLAGDDALEVGELIARQQLALLTGRLPDIARLDPERHRRAAGRS
jgi:hypothetical protein